MKATLACAALLLCGSLSACSGAEDKGTSSSSGSSSGATSSSGASTPGESTSGPVDPAPTSNTPPDTAPPAKTVAAPKLTELMKMMGGLHVMWDLPVKTDCDTIEAERKSDTEDYKLAWSVPGTVDNKHDAKATGDAMYTYRLRCKIGADYSAYSAEMSRNPIK